MSQEEIDIVLENSIYGDYKFLYISPERISSSLFQARVQKMNLNLIAVDEAHCISQWGYDFRPSYLKIALLRDIISKKCLSLLQPHNSQVADDIMNSCNSGKECFRTNFEQNIYFVNVEDKGSFLIKT